MPGYLVGLTPLFQLVMSLSISRCIGPSDDDVSRRCGSTHKLIEICSEVKIGTACAADGNKHAALLQVADRRRGAEA